MGPRRAQARVVGVVVEDVARCAQGSQSDSFRADSVLGLARRLWPVLLVWFLPPPDFPFVL